jgi:protein-tyrosine phosphatase
VIGPSGDRKAKAPLFDDPITSSPDHPMCSNCCVASRFAQIVQSSKDYVVIDIHCHLLPEVDDGPKSWDVAVEMCRMAAADGITHAVATPHANDRYAYDREYLTGLLGQLRDQLREKLDPAVQIQLSLGCDFHLSFENLERVLEQPHTYTIGETNYLLIELSNFSVPTRLSECFTRLGDRGLTPILTHPERNPILQQTPQRILEWAEQGCLMQVTASALTGFWGERPEIVARWLLDRSAVHILASDAHDTRRRIPNLSAGRAVAEKIVGAQYAEALVEGNPGAIVKGMPIPYCPRPVLD